MASLPRVRRLWDYLMSSGAYPGESDIGRGGRRIVVGYFFFGALTRLIFAAGQLSEGNPEGVVDLSAALLSVVALGALRRKPDWFVGIVNVMLFVQLVEVLAATVIDGGLVPSELVILFGLVSVLGALIILSVRAAFGWLLAYGVTLVLAVVLPNWIEPLNNVEGSTGGMARTVFGVTVFVFAGMAYFVRQRDRFQRESDDLLHNILPDEIARRLKAERTMIADHYESASVLFADVVNFTPMSTAMSPAELVGLLNTLFTTFDGFVEELGLEKIKTVGDAYMVAAGVPVARSDHGYAIAELALRMRDHTENSQFDGRDIRLRIGINSGPVVAGIVGTHKFAYDLWGDAVNTASRMESSGEPGAIQISAPTYDRIKADFECDRRGTIDVKGKGQVETWFLVGRRQPGATSTPAT